MSDLIAKFSKISLADISKSDSSKFPELSAEQKALASQFETLANRLNEQESLIALNDSLRTKTFIVGNIPSHADLVVLKKYSLWLLNGLAKMMLQNIDTFSDGPIWFKIH